MQGYTCILIDTGLLQSSLSRSRKGGQVPTLRFAQGSRQLILNRYSSSRVYPLPPATSTKTTPPTSSLHSLIVKPIQQGECSALVG